MKAILSILFCTVVIMSTACSREEKPEPQPEASAQNQQEPTKKVDEAVADEIRRNTQ